MLHSKILLALKYLCQEPLSSHEYFCIREKIFFFFFFFFLFPHLLQTVGQGEVVLSKQPYIPLWLPGGLLDEPANEMGTSILCSHREQLWDVFMFRWEQLSSLTLFPPPPSPPLRKLLRRLHVPMGTRCIGSDWPRQSHQASRGDGPRGAPRKLGLPKGGQLTGRHSRLAPH